MFDDIEYSLPDIHKERRTLMNSEFIMELRECLATNPEQLIIIDQGSQKRLKIASVSNDEGEAAVVIDVYDPGDF